MRLIFLLSLCFFSANINGQSDFAKQYWLIKSNLPQNDEKLTPHAGVNTEIYKDTFLIDHIIRKYSGGIDLKNFISNKYYLSKFKAIQRNDNIIRLGINDSSSIEIFIKNDIITLKSLGKIEYDSSVFNNVKTEMDFTFIKSINNQRGYGLRFDTSDVRRISDILLKVDGKSFFVDAKLFSDLYFPVFNETSYALKPIEAFLSPNKKFVYIYIFGGQSGDDYLCKIIYDLVNKVSVGRMLAEASELSVYHCYTSFDFIGF